MNLFYLKETNIKKVHYPEKLGCGLNLQPTKTFNII